MIEAAFLVIGWSIFALACFSESAYFYQPALIGVALVVFAIAYGINRHESRKYDS